jgi:hypothetical protein
MNRCRSMAVARRSRHHRRIVLSPPRCGVALMLVMSVIIVAAVLGYAMLSHASLTQQVSANSSHSAAAQGMAESGVNLAIYYLQNPEKSTDYPATYPDTERYDREGKYWQGTSGQFVDFGSPSIGSVKVTVKRTNPLIRWQYDVVALGRSPGSTLERTVNATVYLDSAYKFEHAAQFTNDVTLTGATKIGVSGQTVGDVYSNGGLIMRTGGFVWGRGYRRKNTSSPTSPSLLWADAGLVPKVVPLPAEIRSYQTYQYPSVQTNNGPMLTGVTEMGSLLGIPVEKHGPTTGNAAGIYYVPGNLKLKAGTEIDGTLIVQGNVSVEGTNVWIHSRNGFPALIVTGNLTFSNLLLSQMTVDGVAYVGGRVDAGGLIPTFNVNGALLVAGANPIFASSPLAKLNIIRDPSKVNVPDFAEVGRTPTSVKVLGWQGQ